MLSSFIGPVPDGLLRGVPISVGFVLADAMSETTTWQEQFKEAVAQYVIERGYVTNADSTDRRSNYYGGPFDYDATRHLRSDLAMVVKDGAPS